MKKTPLTLLLAAGFLGAASAQATVLVNYTFSGTPATTTATTVDGSITASSVSLFSITEDTSRSGVLGLTAANSDPSAPIFYLEANSGTFSFEDPTPGEGLISFIANSFNSGSNPISWQVYVSTDYDPNTGTLAENHNAATWTALGTASSTTQSAGSILISESLAGFSGSSIVAFKINVNGAQGWYDSGIDNLQVTGAVPEPSTYALLLGFVALGAVIVRRRIKN